MAARCCWCQSPLGRWTQPGVVERPWLCPTDACKTRVLQSAVILKQKGKPLRPVYLPLPKQREWTEAALTPRITRLLVGGAAGPGKSYWLRQMLYHFAQTIPGFHGLLLRRTFPDLAQSHLRYVPYECSLRGMTWRVSDRVIEVPHKDAAASIIRCGHLEDAGALQNYLSAEYDVIAPDELVTFSKEECLELFTRARSSNPHLAKLRGGDVYAEMNEDGEREVVISDGSLVIASTNPGGKGAHWIKQFFISKDPDPEESPNYRPEAWHFCSARLKDNPYLSRAYMSTLRDLPDVRRRQLLDGDWDIFSGQFFSWMASRHVADLHITP